MAEIPGIDSNQPRHHVEKGSLEAEVWYIFRVRCNFAGIVGALLRRFLGLDHGIGHSLLLLYDVKAPNGQKSNEFKDLGHYPSNASLSTFQI
jgi:hypothetical protein